MTRIARGFSVRFGLVLILTIAAALACVEAPRRATPTAVSSDLKTDLTQFIEREMEDKGLPALSIVLVDDQKVAWAEGFGMADPDRGIPATADTIYRVGSVSKLFTDIGIMQLVERGEVDLDAPITAYLPDLDLRNPFPKEITLRQLMSHRSGLIREPPVGHYFDDTGPSLAETVASLDGAEVVYPPESRTKYSNAGIAVVGYVLERLSGEPFARVLRRRVLDPMEMKASGFEPTEKILSGLAKARMWSYDGREFEAPTFELGTSPAGSMYSSVLDLARFMSTLFNDGRGPGGRVLEPETLELMFRPQYGEAGKGRSFGIGFVIDELDGHRLLGHGGAIYGFATQLAFLPEEKIGVAAVSTFDCSNRVIARVAERALRLMLAESDSGSVRPAPSPSPEDVDPLVASSIAGRYERGDQSIELVRRGGDLICYIYGKRHVVKSLGDELIIDDRLRFGPTISIQDDASLEVGDETFHRVDRPKPAPIPRRWKGLIGEYGWDHNVLFILERDGVLHALIEWFDIEPLREISEDTFALPDERGLYHGEMLTFRRDVDGRAVEAHIGPVVFKRREIGVAEGETFRIDPVRPVEELRRLASAARPPDERGDFRSPDLVELTSLDPTIKLDIRYASTNNFMGALFYDEPRAFLQRPAAEAVVRAHRNLAEHGYGLLIHDAYRPWYVTKMFWDATPLNKKDFVADPDEGSVHNRGCAVDLTLYDLATGEPVQMVGAYDEMTERSYADYEGGTSLQRWHRDLLRDAMEAEGFMVYEFEWWHFDYRSYREYPVLNLKFDEIDELPGR